MVIFFIPPFHLFISQALFSHIENYKKKKLKDDQKTSLKANEEKRWNPKYGTEERSLRNQRDRGTDTEEKERVPAEGRDFQTNPEMLDP